MDVSLIFEIAGFAGVAFYLGSYGALQAGLVSGNSYTYAVLNLIAASLVLVSLFGGWNTWSAIIQVSWIAISIGGFLRVWLITRSLRFNPEEEALIRTRFPILRRLDARRLLDRGTWRDGQPDEELTRQGVPVDALTYIASGGVEIEVDGKVIAQVGSAELIGEMACMSKGPASATVRLTQPSRIFSVPADALIRLAKSNPELGAQIDFALAGNMRSKLVSTNALLHQALSGDAGPKAAG